MRSQAKKLWIYHFKYIPKYKYTTFKASNGWIRRFIKISKIKLGKKKSGKPLSANEYIEEYLKLLVRMRFQVLQSNNKDDITNPLWGRFPPELCYNIYQVPLPFVVNHYSTFNKNYNNDIHIYEPSDALRKRPFTMHAVVNLGSGDKCQGFIDIIFKGTGKIISKKEQDIWDARSKVFSRIMHGLILQ